VPVIHSIDTPARAETDKGTQLILTAMTCGGKLSQVWLSSTQDTNIQQSTANCQLPSTLSTTPSSPNYLVNNLKNTGKMMEYFAYKKVKKHQAEKKAAEGKQSPLLDEKDETFLRRVISAEGTPPPLPARPQDLSEAGNFSGNASQMVVHDGNTVAEEEHRRSSKDKGKGKEKEHVEAEAKKPGRFSFLSRVGTKKVCIFHILLLLGRSVRVRD